MVGLGDPLSHDQDSSQGGGALNVQEIFSNKLWFSKDLETCARLFLSSLNSYSSVPEVDIHVHAL